MPHRLPLNKSRRVVVFDLDETLGAFSDASVLWQAALDAGIHTPDESSFASFLDRFPRYIRPGMVPLLRDLCRARDHGLIDHIIIMTNNQGPKQWTQRIANQFSRIQGEPVFDHIIHAYHGPEGRREVRRTSHDKSLADLCRCCRWNQSDPPAICFVDDRYHSLSSAPGVIYIPVSPYRFSPSAGNAARLLNPDPSQSPRIDALRRFLVSRGLPARSPILTRASEDNALLISGLSMLLRGGAQKSHRRSRRCSVLTRRRLRMNY